MSAGAGGEWAVVDEERVADCVSFGGATSGAPTFDEDFAEGFERFFFFFGKSSANMTLE